MSVNAPLWTLKLLPVWKQVFADKCLNETTEVVEVLLEIGLFEGLCLVSDSAAFLLSLVLVSDKKDSDFYVKIRQDHNWGYLN